MAKKPRRYYGFRFCPNGYYSKWGSRGHLVVFTSQADRDEWVTSAPPWGDTTIGGRMALMARDRLTDPGLHESFCVYNLSPSA